MIRWIITRIIGFFLPSLISSLFNNKEEETIVMTREVEGIIRITHAIYTNAVIETYTNKKPSEITLGDGSQARIIIIQE